MDIKFIGTGGAFDYEYLNSSALVTVNGLKILVDCGHAIYPALRKLKAEAVMDYVVLTHLHDDHSGSVASLLAHNQIFNKRKLTILYPNESFHEDLMQLFSYTLNDPSKYADFQPMEKVDGINNIDTTGYHVAGFPTFAYYFEEGNQRIVYSGDLGNCKVLFSALDQLEPKETTVFHDIAFHPENKAHTYYKDLERFADKYRIIGYHCDPRKNPEDNRIPLAHDLEEYLLR